MKFPDLASATGGDIRLLRAAAITFIGAIPPKFRPKTKTQPLNV